MRQQLCTLETTKMQIDTMLTPAGERPTSTVTSLPMVSYTADLSGGFSGPRFLSDSIAGAIGFRSAEFIDDCDLWIDRIHRDDLTLLEDHFRTIFETGSSSIHYRWRCADGSERVFLDQAMLIRDGSGSPSEIRGTCLDITYRRQAEREMLRTQSMEAFAQLAFGLAHDFSNMLSVVTWNLDLLGQSLKHVEKDFDRVQAAMSGALSCNDLLHELLAFTRRTPHCASNIDLRKSVQRAVAQITSLLGEEISIEIALSNIGQTIYADPGQIEAALVTLAISARDTMPHGGTLTIKCDGDGCGLRQDGHIDTHFDPNDYVAMNLSYTGNGISQDAIDRIMGRHFVSHEPGDNSWLGLRMVCSFIEQSGGHASVESSAEVGTKIRLYFPKASLPEVNAQLEPLADEISRTRETHVVLIVEDNSCIRASAAEQMVNMGCRVLTADSAAAALKIIRSEARIDLLFTDVVMPGGMDGFALARNAVELRPGIKVLFTSGYISTDHQIGGLFEGFLAKPYREHELQHAVKSVILKDDLRDIHPDRQPIPNSFTDNCVSR